MPFIAKAQEHIRIIKQATKDATFAEVSNQVNSYFESLPDDGQRRRAGYKQWKRWEWYASMHLDADGKVGAWSEYNAKAIQQIAAQPALLSINGSWSSVGPSSVTNNQDYLGRVECVAFHPTDPNIMYVGTATGGVWRTTNKGSSWTAMSDHLPSLSIGGLAVHPSNGNIIYALTGDGDGGNQWGYYVKERGSGVFKSTDGGVNWEPSGLQFDRSGEEVYGYKLLIHPSNGNILHAATSNGIYRTTDGGNNWTRVSVGEYQDIEYRPGNTNQLAAVRWGSSSLWRSFDGGVTWIGRTIPGGGADRSEIAVSANAPNNVYILMGPPGVGSFRGLYRYQWSDSSFTLITNTPNVFNGANDGAGDGGFSWWATALGVSPTNVNNMLVGGVIGRRSTNGGTTITGDHDILHADQHGYWYNPIDGNAVYATNDGGIFRSTNNGDTWTNLTTRLRITQYYRISTCAANTNALLGGTQDNGHYYRTSNTTAYLHTLTCCDGMDNAIDPTNTNIIYMCSQNGGLNRSTDAGVTWTGISPQASSWVAPILLHSNTRTTIFFAGNGGIWRSTNSGISGWVNIGADGRGAMAQGTSFDARFYAAGNNTTLRRSDNVNDATPTWTIISGNTGWPTTGMANSQITGITVNPNNSQEVWVCLSGYNAANKVLRSTDMGNTWTNMTGALPNLPVHTIKFAPSASGYQVYIGTDIGVFYRSNNTTNWIYFSNGLPRVMVTDIEIVGDFIYAGTYGRGAWRSDLYGNCPVSLTYNITNFKGEWVIQASQTITTATEIFGGAGTNVHMRAGVSVTLNPGFEAKAGNIYRASIGNCNATLPLGPVVPLEGKKEEAPALPERNRQTPHP